MIDLLTFMVGPLVFLAAMPVMYGLAVVSSASFRENLRRQIRQRRRDRRVIKAADWANDHDDLAVTL